MREAASRLSDNELFFERPETGQRAVLVHVRFSQLEELEEIAEFEDLVRSADIQHLAILIARDLAE